MHVDIQQLIDKANEKALSNQVSLYASFIRSILQEPNLTLLLNTREDIQKAVTDFSQEVVDQKKQSKNTQSVVPSEHFYKVLLQQKNTLGFSEDNEFSVLLASLKMLDDVWEKSLYKSTLKDIIVNNLHKIRILPLENPFIGRKDEQASISRILDRSHKNNVLIVGAEGVGKTTLARAIFQQLQNDIAFQLYPGSNSFHDRIITLLSVANGKRILFFLDEIFSFDIEHLQQALDNKQITLIATASESSFTKFANNHPEIIAKFEVIHLQELPADDTKQILTNRMRKLQVTLGVSWEEGFVDELYILSKQYLLHLLFPAKGLLLLDEAVSLAKSQGLSHVAKDVVRLLISQRTNIPIGNLTELDKKDLSMLPEKLQKRVKGQDRAIESVVRVIQRSRLGFGKKNKPVGSFLFVGPSGVGKTELAKTVAQVIFGDEDSMVRLDMSEYTEAHTIQRLIGAPPGYVGFEEGGQLTNPVKAKPYNLVLLDEIEKAHPRVFDIFLQVLDDGRLTDGQGKMVDFRNTIVIATSNAGIEDMLDLLAEGKSTEEMEKEMKDILQDYFRIEFINRFDGIILFNALQAKALEEIAQLQIEKLQLELAKRDIDFSVSDQVIKQIAKMSYDPRYGARELLRFIQDNIENKLAEMIISGQLENKQKIVF